MRGTLIEAWPYAWEAVWLPVRDSEWASEQLLPDLVRELVKALPTRGEVTVVDAPIAPQPEPFIMAMADRKQAEDFIREVNPLDFRSERHLIRAFEEFYFVVEEYDSPELTNLYSNLISQFLRRYNLRYRLVQPFQIVPHIPGVIGSLVEHITDAAKTNQDMVELLEAVEQAFEDLTTRSRPSDIKTCIAKVCSLTEGLAVRYPGVTAGTLGEATKELDCWPHATIKNSLSSLYGFCSDYPAIRHAGKAKSKLRELELRDALIVSILFLSFSGYLTDIDYAEVFALKGAL